MRRVVSILVMFAVVGGTAARADESDRASIVVRIDGLEDDDGAVRCGLYTRSNWLESERALQWVDATDAEGDAATCEFSPREAGTYAVGAFHDSDADHDIDSNALGIPTEGLCASTDPEPSMSAPSFRGAKFEHDGDTATTVACTMRY